MTKFIVKAKKLNVRKVIPSFLPDPDNIVGVVQENFVFEAEEVATVPNIALGKWYIDRNKSFYWGGGIAEIVESIQADFDDYQNLSFVPAKMSWAHNFLEIPLIWKQIQSAGKGITIAVIDSGANINIPDLAGAILSNSISIDAEGKIDDATNLTDRLKDNVGHGTEMAGIIAAKGIQVYGIAPESKLLIIKVTDSRSGLAFAPIAAAFKWLSTQNDIKVDVISASFALIDNPEVKTSVEACINRGIAIFAAIGDNHIPDDKEDDTFPACYPSCTAIGSFDIAGQLCSFSNQNDHLSLLAPGDENILTIGSNNTPVNGAETSIATAVAAASFSLALSLMKARPGFNGRAVDFLDLLYHSATDMGSQIGRDPMHGFGRLNIRNAISKIINRQI